MLWLVLFGLAAAAASSSGSGSNSMTLYKGIYKVAYTQGKVDAAAKKKPVTVAPSTLKGSLDKQVWMKGYMDGYKGLKSKV